MPEADREVTREREVTPAAGDIITTTVIATRAIGTETTAPPVALVEKSPGKTPRRIPRRTLRKIPRKRIQRRTNRSIPGAQAPTKTLPRLHQLP